MAWTLLDDTEIAHYRVGDLKDPRPRVAFSRQVTWFMKLSVLFRLVFLITAMRTNQEGMFATNFQALLQGMLIEMLFTTAVFLKFARWEDQEHWVTLWQALYVFEFLSVRQALYNNPWFLAVGMAGLYLTYFTGVYTELTKWELPRVPPFTMKKNDMKKPKFGWLGKSLSRLVTFKLGRMFITFIMYMSGMAFAFFLFYAMFISEIDDFRNLPIYRDQFKTGTQVTDDNAMDVMHPVLLIAVIFGALTFLPATLVEFAAIPGLISDWMNFKKGSRSYNTGVWDICELDEDKDGPGSQLKQILQKPVLDTTIVLPCYLPNEEDILPFVLDHYMKEYEKLAQYEQASTKCKKEILVVYNSPNQHPNFPPVIKDWQQKFEARGFKLTVRENKESTSKCDNLNFACEIIETEVALCNDADTMLDWTCIVRGSEHIRNGYDLAQAMNSHCLYDRNGTPGDENERQCHPYGILITIGDATKPQNMSTQTPYKHAPFNGRGGFWRTASLKKVGFDHRTVGEDHDAGYRGFAYFGFKGLLDMNMLCQEQQPPDCQALTSQRIRWETAALEMRRTFSWILRSPHYGRFETFVLLWGQMQQNCNMPFQSLAFQVVGCMPLIMMKSWLSIYALGAVNDVNMTLQKLCERDNCVISFEDVKSPISGELFNIALPLPIAIFAAMTIIFMIINGFDFIIRVLTTRYRPSLMFFVYYGVLKQMFVAPYFCYVQYWAMYDYCWGGAKFIATARSPLSPKSEQAALEKPLLPR
jgi:hypothetical protein